ncbi:Ribosomal RNA large subunit methyltransferase H [Dissostichus eleginoides]|uniref:Ribosomal RNA large subunit methyltransferase H n=1 Tax=Dissostichus eleginoides TaxID=100907 RepID=A0AAD9B852_DISEL|nr:Ribosomal RNA large subunit methyltransferase H [Dissostichus eleginoides]
MRRTASQLAASTISLVETGPRTSAAVMENSPVEMAGLRDGSWIVLGVWQRGAQSEYSGAGIPRIAEHDGELVLLMAGRQRLGAKQQPNIIGWATEMAETQN